MKNKGYVTKLDTPIDDEIIKRTIAFSALSMYKLYNYEGYKVEI